MDEQSYEARRDARHEARERKQHRIRIATAVFRDLMLLERWRLDELPDGVELPVDLKCCACVATEAADALLNALDPPVDAPVLPPYES